MHTVVLVLTYGMMEHHTKPYSVNFRIHGGNTGRKKHGEIDQDKRSVKERLQTYAMHVVYTATNYVLMGKFENKTKKSSKIIAG